MTWYKLIKDVNLIYNYYGKHLDEIKVTLFKGSYIDTLERKQYSYQTDYTEIAYIPKDAVIQVNYNPSHSVYFDEQGNEYYADPGKYIEGRGWEYANLESRIRTGNRIYYQYDS